MKTPTYHLSDRTSRILARILVTRIHDDLWIGQLTPESWPAELRALFLRYETLINDQVLAKLDEVENEIATHGFHLVALDTGETTPITDLQIMSDQSVSFRVPAGYPSPLARN